MRIAFDVDGVVLQSIDIILEHINNFTGKEIPSESLLTWDLEPLGLHPELLKDTANYMYSMESIAPYDGAVDTLER